MPFLKKHAPILLGILGLQFVSYALFLRPAIFSWGATEQECRMALPGDHLAPYIGSTRAITINASSTEVWQWIIQLGADRGGFFSYTFIEELLGYEARARDKITPAFTDMKVGRIVPGSLDQSKSIIEFNFPVVSVEPGKSYVLQGWGAFVVQPIDAEKTRLIVRTHGQQTSALERIYDDYFNLLPHYIMERRMLMGFKARAEAGAGEPFSSTADMLWFLGVIFSAVGILVSVFLVQGLPAITIAAIFGVAWLWPLLVFDPRPVYSWTLLSALLLTIPWIRRKNNR